MRLSSELVEKVFMGCLFTEGENTSDRVVAEGITSNVGFHPGRLGGHRDTVVEMLDGLPDSFKESGGGGMSFLNACEDKDGQQWTGLHQRMEQLFQPGRAIGRARCPVAREIWPSLPGGMPYYIVEDGTNHGAAKEER